MVCVGGGGGRMAWKDCCFFAVNGTENRLLLPAVLGVSQRYAVDLVTQKPIAVWVSYQYISIVYSSCTHKLLN